MVRTVGSHPGRRGGRDAIAARARLYAVHVDVAIAEGLLVTGRERELASAVHNLVDNAARHATSRVAGAGAIRDGTSR